MPYLTNNEKRAIVAAVEEPGEPKNVISTKYGIIKITYWPEGPYNCQFWGISGTAEYTGITALEDTYQDALEAWMQRAADHVVA